MKKHNFNAGPSILPREVIEDTAKAILDFNGSGLSLMEISHRAKDFQPVVDEAVALFKELLNIPEGYSVLFLGGGASMEFCMVPYNFLEKKAAYLNTGVWAKKAMKEAKAFGEVVEVASSAEATYTLWYRIERRSQFSGSDGCRYVFRYILSSYRRIKIYLYLWWCTKESGTCGCYFCNCEE